jgi:hypothetical protein
MKNQQLYWLLVNQRSTGENLQMKRKENNEKFRCMINYETFYRIWIFKELLCKFKPKAS